MALWWLLRAGVTRVGLVGVPFPCGAGRTFGGFEAWQTAALSAYKKPLLRPGAALEPLLWPGGALQPLLWPCGGFCVREWRVLGLLGYLFPAELGGLLEGFEAWQTAALNAYKKPLLRPGGALEPLLSPCGGFCLRAWRVWGCPSAIAVALWWLLRAGVARVGLVGVPFPCGAGRTFGGFGAFEAWQTAALNAYKRPL